MAQQARGDPIDRLASQVRWDPSFPCHGTLVEIRHWLAAKDDNESALVHLAAAERCWLTL
jgi:hypothetical protein